MVFVCPSLFLNPSVEQNGLTMAKPTNSHSGMSMYRQAMVNSDKQQSTPTSSNARQQLLFVYSSTEHSLVPLSSTTLLCYTEKDRHSQQSWIDNQYFIAEHWRNGVVLVFVHQHNRHYKIIIIMMNDYAILCCILYYYIDTDR